MRLVLIHTAVASPDEAQRLATALLAAKVAACVSVGRPMTSYYYWQGQLQASEEYPLTIKTTAAQSQAVMRLIRHQHAYEVPEIVVTAVLDADNDFAAWVESEVNNA